MKNDTEAAAAEPGKTETRRVEKQAKSATLEEPNIQRRRNPERQNKHVKKHRANNRDKRYKRIQGEARTGVQRSTSRETV